MKKTVLTAIISLMPYLTHAGHESYIKSYVAPGQTWETIPKNVEVASNTFSLILGSDTNRTQWYIVNTSTFLNVVIDLATSAVTCVHRGVNTWRLATSTDQAGRGLSSFDFQTYIGPIYGISSGEDGNNSPGRVKTLSVKP